MDEIKQDIKEVADDQDIAQYKAAMLEYLEASKAESKVKARKERLKRIIEATMSRIHRDIEAVGIPESDQYAVAFHYTQEQPRFNAELAAQMVSPDILGKIYTKQPITCFTVRAMSEEAMLNKIHGDQTA
jgi:hypothetical protein